MSTHTRPLLTNPSSDSQGTLPRPTSLEAILHPVLHAAGDDTTPDPRLRSAREWTSVTSDTRILVSILSAWTTREYSYYHYLDRDAFLDDMAGGRWDFCSELLVNALLASACVSLKFCIYFTTVARFGFFSLWTDPKQSTSSAVKERSIPFSDVSIMTDFYKEALRLWNLEAGRSSLTRIQAGICLCKICHHHTVLHLPQFFEPVQ
jgi:hypothetical protein